MIGFENAVGKRAGAAVAVGLAAALVSTSAWAQCTTTQTGLPSGNLSLIATPSGAAASTISGAIGNANTVFLTQQGSAFVSAPANPAPGQPGGGVWARAIGGEVTVNSTSDSSLLATRTGLGTTTQTTNCVTSERQNFAGVQVGADIAKLNWNGWNVHLGTTAGYLGSNSSDSYGFSNKFEIPFFGTYLVATYGRFFADVMIRNDYYNITLNNPGFLFFGQPVGAHGYSASTSAGYNFALQNNWFIEPSAGFIYSKTKVDSFTYTGTTGLGIGGTVAPNDITSEIGRLSLRFGTVVATPTVVWQPFASVSVFHEFAGNTTTNFTSFANNGFYTSGGVTVPSTYAQTTSTSRVGTYGQYSLGVAGQVVNTGWLGFVRVDYRNGDKIDGWTGNAGLRYQFTPGAMDAMAADMPLKVKAPRAAYVTNWTGFYVGGFFGGDAGRTNIAFTGLTPDARPWATGILGGGQIGYNWQGANPWVFGVEGDIGAGNIKGGQTCGTATGIDATGTPVGFSPAYYTCNDKTNWVATATARVGYSYDRTLYYVRGGGAWEDGKVSADCVIGPTGILPDGTRACRNPALAIVPSLSTSQTRAGWLIGFGTEFDLGRGWSAKTEYNYIDFGRHTATATDGTSVLTDRSSTSQVKVGVNYRFGPGAVVAKY